MVGNIVKVAGTRHRGCSPLFLSFEKPDCLRLENQSEPKFELTTSLLGRVVSEIRAVYVVLRTEAVDVIEHVVRLYPDLRREVFTEH